MLLASGIAVLAVAGWVAFPHARHFYHEWSRQRLSRRAAEFYAKGDFKHAVLDAKGALDFDPMNIEATRILAKSLEALHSAQALDWRRRLDAIAPGDVENRLAWARGALQSGDRATAEQLLKKIPPAEQNTALYHNLAATLALGRRDTAAAESHWLEASKLDPQEDKYKLNLASLRLTTGSTHVRAGALKILNDMRSSPSERLPALRALLGDAMGHGESARAKELAGALAADPNASLSDKLLRLSTLRTLNDPDFASLLGPLQEAAASKPEEIYQMMAWMNRYNLTREVSDWVERLPWEITSKPPVCIAIADSYAIAKDWVKLQDTLEETSWQQFEYMRFASLSRTLDRLGDRSGAAAAWKSALGAAQDRSDRLEALAKAALSWAWEQRAEEALWELAKDERCPRWALESLWSAALKKGDADQLHRVTKLILRADPKSVPARNNFAFLALLIRSEEGAPHQLAETLYKENPGNSAVVTTYALSLYLQGRAKAAVGVMVTLKPEQLREPAVAMYYGTFLLSIRQIEKGEEFLSLAEKWPALPEERALVAAAKLRTLAAPQPESDPEGRKEKSEIP